MLKNVLPALLAAFVATACVADTGSPTPSPGIGHVSTSPKRAQLALWPSGAPDEPPGRRSVEKIIPVSKANGVAYTAISDVSAPTLTIYPPKAPSTGASVIVFPGGGFNILAIDIEGTEICDWLTARGITCVLLKYRVPGSNHYYDKACRCHKTPEVLTSLQDAQRAIRIVRHRAKEWQLDPGKIGVIGFSAGGYLVAQTSNIVESTYDAIDGADAVSSRPDFAIALYPGHLCRAGATLDPEIHVTRQTPPTFLLHAWDDPVDDICNSMVYARALEEVGVPTEVHFFAEGGHAFGLRKRSSPIDIWPTLVEHWLGTIDVL